MSKIDQIIEFFAKNQYLFIEKNAVKFEKLMKFHPK